MTDRERDLLAKVEQVRNDVNSRLDELADALQENATPPSPAPRTRRAPMRPPIGGKILITTDIAKAKARAALERMGLLKVRG